jgi:hypothetical protein
MPTLSRVIMASLVGAMLHQANIHPARAADDIKIIVVAVDSDESALVSSSSITDAAASSINDAFHRCGYQVIGKAQIQAAAKVNFPDRMTRANVFTAIKSASHDPSFDAKAVITYTIFPKMEEGRTFREMGLEMSGQIDQPDEAFLGKITPWSYPPEPVPIDCVGKACMASIARKMANDIAAHLAHQGSNALKKQTQGRSCS